LAAAGSSLRNGMEERHSTDLRRPNPQATDHIRVSAPYAQRPGQPRLRGVEVTLGEGAPPGRDQPLEYPGVQIVVLDDQVVPARAGRQRAARTAAQQPPQPQHIAAQDTGRRSWRAFPHSSSISRWALIVRPASISNTARTTRCCAARISDPGGAVPDPQRSQDPKTHAHPIHCGDQSHMNRR
jgi:hypothetical protein